MSTPATASATATGRAEIERFRERFERIEREVAQVIVGHADVVRKTLTAFLAGGHVLVEGVPGLGKTLLVRSVSHALGLTFKRIQFTPDLMPSDIIGAQILNEQDGARSFHFRRGPIFANVVLADEINRATPKTQSALLEAMEEHQVTAFGETYSLDEPFFVLATQNPIELEGTYPLPEAQLDRFLFKLVVTSPTRAELTEILRRTTVGEQRAAGPVFDADSAAETIGEMRRLVREVLIAPPLEQRIVALIDAATPGRQPAVPAVQSYVRFGPGPRAAQAIVLGAKVNALLDGRGHVASADVTDVVVPALRHRLILNFQAEAENVSAERIVADVMEATER